MMTIDQRCLARSVEAGFTLHLTENHAREPSEFS
jgi:hypothetical protein